MRILLTNDDGITAPGIIALFDAILDPEARYGGPLAGPQTEVFVVAPLTVQSATGHGVTFHKPLMVSEVQVKPGMRGLAVDARPADCVKLAVNRLWGERFGAGSRPDLILSGMNAGANVGINVIYSGTVAAALEGAFQGIPSIAVSLHLGRGATRFDVAAARGRRVVERILGSGQLRSHDCLTVNIPVTESGGPMPPVRVCPMNTHGLVDNYERRVSPEGRVYYWPAGHGLDFTGLDPNSDVEHLLRRTITVTPLSYDLTRPGHVEWWAKRLDAGGESHLPAIAEGDAVVQGD
ncbi:MAG: 5'/3'-nucleotidase SurE [Phycisphaeraceae bacterium]|nr:MAG: 5'/3'-nucleotidase SurE [Phycisphaeraceae bacterium]